MAIPLTEVVTTSITDVGDADVKTTPVGADAVFIKDSVDGKAKLALLSNIPGGQGGGNPVEIKDSGSQILSAVSSINFGDNLTVTDDGSNSVTITGIVPTVSVTSVLGRTGDIVAATVAPFDYSDATVGATAQGALVGTTVRAQLGELDTANTSQATSITTITTDLDTAEADIAAAEADIVALETLTGAATDAATASTLVKRDASSRFKAADPSAATDVVTKQFAEALGTSSATASTIMRRDANGRAQVATPSVDGDIATKGYVLSQFTAATHVDVPIAFDTDTFQIQNFPAAETEVSQGDFRVGPLDLTYADTITLNVYRQDAAPAGSVLRLSYSTNGGGAWTSLTGGDCALSATGRIVGSAITLPTGAKTTATLLRIVSYGGDGAAEVWISHPEAVIRYNVSAIAGGYRDRAILTLSASNTVAAQTIRSFTLPANTLTVDGDWLDFTALGTYTESSVDATDGPTIRFLNGATVCVADFSSGVGVNASPRTWVISGKMWRISSTKVGVTLTLDMGNPTNPTTGRPGAINVAPSYILRRASSVVAGVTLASTGWNVDQTFTLDFALPQADASISMTGELWTLAGPVLPPAGGSSMTGAAIKSSLDSELALTPTSRWRDATTILQADANSQGMPDEIATSMSTSGTFTSAWVDVTGGTSFTLAATSVRKSQAVKNSRTTAINVSPPPGGATLAGSGSVAASTVAVFKATGTTSFVRWS